MSDSEDAVTERLEWLLKAMKPRVELTRRRPDELVADITRWRKPDPMRTSLVVEETPECSWYIQVDAVNPPPAIDHWGMQIAEIAHRLRTRPVCAILVSPRAMYISFVWLHRIGPTRSAKSARRAWTGTTRYASADRVSHNCGVTSSVFCRHRSQ